MRFVQKLHDCIEINFIKRTDEHSKQGHTNYELLLEPRLFLVKHKTAKSFSHDNKIGKQNSCAAINLNKLLNK